LLRGSKHLSNRNEGGFSQQFSGYTLGGELRLYPFGAPRSYELGKFMRHGFNSLGSMGESWALRHLNGLFIAGGYEIRRGELALLPDPGLNSPWPRFGYQIADQGLTLQLGYGIVLSHFSLEIGYRFRFLAEEIEGPVNDVLQPAEVGQNTYLNQPAAGSLRFSVGLAF